MNRMIIMEGLRVLRRDTMLSGMTNMSDEERVRILKLIDDEMELQVQAENRSELQLVKLYANEHNLISILAGMTSNINCSSVPNKVTSIVVCSDVIKALRIQQ